MTSSNSLGSFTLKRRQLVLGAAIGLSYSLLPKTLYAQSTPESLLKAASQAEINAVTDGFMKGATPLETGLSLQMPVLGDNPAAVPVKVKFDVDLTPDSYCEELIILAEGNPRPLACRLSFTPLAGTTEVAVRLRLIESQTIRAIARMNDGRFLMARQHITVTAGGCGM